MRLSDSTKSAFIRNIDLINYCQKSGINIEKLNKCNIERMGNNYVFVLDKNKLKRSKNEISLDTDLDNQPDVVLIMAYHGNNNFSFETTDKTIRIVNNKV